MADDIAQGDSGASKTEPIRGGEVKKGMTVMLKGHPCKVVEVTTSKTGKHGHAKANITGIDIFTNKKYEEICPTSHNLTRPFVLQSNWILTDIDDDNMASLLNEDTGEMREDLAIPGNEEYTSLRDAFEAAQAEEKDFYVSVLKAATEENGKLVDKERIMPSGYNAKSQ